ncbi:MAG: DUF4468 domain-containing protein [Bacteroidetes bacterium]|nr:DUF4468 domain-containing protein [Bacteroidota bacterium]
MKKIAILISVGMMSVLTLSAQVEVAPPLVPIDESTGLITYKQVAEIPGVSKDILFDRAVEWGNGFFKNPSSVMSVKEKENGKISGKHGINVYKIVEGTKHRKGVVKYKLTIGIKEGKSRIMMTDIYFHQSPKIPLEKWLDPSDPNIADNYSFVGQVDEHMRKMMADFTKKMTTEAKAATDDW